jgi:cobalt-precorrin 5A hydrolase/precorrin-3B C17-methyltransferase
MPSKGGLLSLISLGPGDVGQMTIAAQSAVKTAEIVIGYEIYINLVLPLLSPDQEIIRSPIGSELERAVEAVELAAQGRQVALISSGDIGVYGMASPLFETLQAQQDRADLPEVEVYPGVSAIHAAAARLGAPLGHDYCTISLSDLLTPWHVIERRIEAAAWGDFVIGFYNPRSQPRDWQLPRAVDILRLHRSRHTPVAVVRNVTRPDEQVRLSTLADVEPGEVDMFSLVLVGNSQTFAFDHRLITPRGYSDKFVGSQTAAQAGDPSPLDGPAAADVNLKDDLYPLSLIGTAGAQAVVVGGGPVGQRKTQGLLNAGLKVCLISPEATHQIQVWAKTERIEWQPRPYRAGDLAGAQLVFAATNERRVNAQVAREARALGLLCNVADEPGEGNFHVPAVHRQAGGLIVAVSTAGTNPVRARQVRDSLARWLAGDK